MSDSGHIAILAAAASAIVGLLALWVSLRSSRTSASALRLAERTYFSGHRLAVRSSAEEDYLLLSPEGVDQTINSIALYFPRKTEISPIALASGSLKLFHTRISSALQNYWDSRTSVVPGSAAVRANAAMPVVALIHGHTKGEASVTVGYYDLYCQYVRIDDGSSSLTIRSLALNNYGLPDDDPQETADRILREIEALFPPASNPCSRPAPPASDEQR